MRNAYWQINLRHDKEDGEFEDARYDKVLDRHVAFVKALVSSNDDHRIVGHVTGHAKHSGLQVLAMPAHIKERQEMMRVCSNEFLFLAHSLDLSWIKHHLLVFCVKTHDLLRNARSFASLLLVLRLENRLSS